MSQQSKLFLSVVAFASASMFYACEYEAQPKLSPIDSLRIEMDYRLARLEYLHDSTTNELESIRIWIYDVEKENRTAEYYARKDYLELRAVCDSMAKARPHEGKVWKRIGWVLGEAAKRIVPGI